MACVGTESGNGSTDFTGLPRRAGLAGDTRRSLAAFPSSATDSGAFASRPCRHSAAILRARSVRASRRSRRAASSASSRPLTSSSDREIVKTVSSGSVRSGTSPSRAFVASAGRVAAAASATCDPANTPVASSSDSVVRRKGRSVNKPSPTSGSRLGLVAAMAHRSRKASCALKIGFSRKSRMVFSPVRISTRAIIPGMIGSCLPPASR